MTHRLDKLEAKTGDTQQNHYNYHNDVCVCVCVCVLSLLYISDQVKYRPMTFLVCDVTYSNYYNQHRRNDTLPFDIILLKYLEKYVAIM